LREKNRDFLQGQIGNPNGADKPNKKFYDPRVWIRAAESSMIKRVMVSMEKLHSTGTYTPSPESGSPQIGAGKKTVNPTVILLAGVIAGSTATLVIKSLIK